MEKRISYLNKTYLDYKQALIDYSTKYYPDLATNFNDSSVGSWMIDLNSEIGDNLSYYIDRAYQETNINSACEKSSVYNIARNNGFKIPGPKGAMAEVRFSCYLPLSSSNLTKGVKEPDWDYAPIIKRGTLVSSSNQTFELLSDIDFSEQFDDNGYSDRVITPVTDSNNVLVKYLVSKYAVVVAGETKFYSMKVNEKDIVPFMEVIIPVEHVMNVESIITKNGELMQYTPSYAEFYMPNETSSTFSGVTRFFEVDYLAQQFRWGEKEDNGMPLKYEYGYNYDDSGFIPTYSVTKGEWKPLKHKFMTEYTDKGYLKVIFGAGYKPGLDVDLSDGNDFSRYQMTKIINNDSLGLLPETGTTLFILYRMGGGQESNLPKGAINTISKLKIEIPCKINNSDSQKREDVRRSVVVLSTTPSVSGKDMPTTEEVKYLTKYNSGAQERCVTTKDYIDRILKLPAKYGTPFRVGVSEENNKIMIYLLGIDSNGYLDETLPKTLVENIQEYLVEYRMINDYIEIKSGRIVNVSFEIYLHVEDGYNEADVKNEVKTLVANYMDINRHNMGDDIYIGDLEKEISKIDGVRNLVSVKVFNEIGEGYSNTMIQQELVTRDSCSDKPGFDAGVRFEVDLEAADKTLYSDGDTMIEIKYPGQNQDIKVITK